MKPTPVPPRNDDEELHFCEGCGADLDVEDHRKNCPEVPERKPFSNGDWLWLIVPMAGFILFLESVKSSYHKGDYHA